MRLDLHQNPPSLTRHLNVDTTLVDWEAIEDHTVGFRQSAEYVKWKDLLHKYYDPFPVVEHYEIVEGQ